MKRNRLSIKSSLLLLAVSAVFGTVSAGQEIEIAGRDILGRSGDITAVFDGARVEGGHLSIAGQPVAVICLYPNPLLQLSWATLPRSEADEIRDELGTRGKKERHLARRRRVNAAIDRLMDKERKDWGVPSFVEGLINELLNKSSQYWSANSYGGVDWLAQAKLGGNRINMKARDASNAVVSAIEKAKKRAKGTFESYDQREIDRLDYIDLSHGTKKPTDKYLRDLANKREIEGWGPGSHAAENPFLPEDASVRELSDGERVGFALMKTGLIYPLSMVRYEEPEGGKGLLVRLRAAGAPDGPPVITFDEKNPNASTPVWLARPLRKKFLDLGESRINEWLPKTRQEVINKKVEIFEKLRALNFFKPASAPAMRADSSGRRMAPSIPGGYRASADHRAWHARGGRSGEAHIEHYSESRMSAPAAPEVTHIDHERIAREKAEAEERASQRAKREIRAAAGARRRAQFNSPEARAKREALRAKMRARREERARGSSEIGAVGG